jgi:hypothetical protein
MQHSLHHGEFVKVGVEQAGDDHVKATSNLVHPMGELIHGHAWRD